MNKVFSTVLNYCGLAALIVSAGLLVTFSSTSKKEKIAVLDVEKVKTESIPFNTINTEALKYISALKARISEEEKALQTEAIALQKRINSSGKKANTFIREIDVINQKAMVLRNKFQVQKQLISRATQSAFQQINPVIEETLKDFSQSEGITIILPKSLITYNEGSVDVTDEFIRVLNKKGLNVVYPDPAQFTTPTPMAVQPTSMPVQGVATAVQNAEESQNTHVPGATPVVNTISSSNNTEVAKPSDNLANGNVNGVK